MTKHDDEPNLKRFCKEKPDDVSPIERVFADRRRMDEARMTKRRQVKQEAAKDSPAEPKRMSEAPDDPDGRWALFDAEACYAESIMRSALGDIDGSIAMLEEALASVPGYVPALYSLGTARYFQGSEDECRRLFQIILDSPADTPDLLKFIDHAGDFYIERMAYDDGLEYYRKASVRFPDHAVFHQGISCCAGHIGRHEEELAAARRALELEPDNQKFVNDLGWSLYQGGDLAAARETLERAVAMDPADDLARENLRIVREEIEAKAGKTDRKASATRESKNPRLPAEAAKTRRKKRRAPSDSPDQATLFED